MPSLFASPEQKKSIQMPEKIRQNHPRIRQCPIFPEKGKANSVITSSGFNFYGCISRQYMVSAASGAHNGLKSGDNELVISLFYGTKPDDQRLSLAGSLLTTSMDKSE